MSDKQLAMVRIALDQKKLAALAQRLSLPLQPFDLGYLAHCALTGLWGKEAPRPFVVEEHKILGKYAPVLGYFQVDPRRTPCDSSASLVQELQDWARIHAVPDIWDLVEWDSFAAKPMPKQWQQGRCYQFEARVCPTVRRGDNRDQDVFLFECGRRPRSAPRLSRPTVYGEWLGQQLEMRGASLLSSSLDRFELRTFLRRNHHESRRSCHLIQGPDASVSGLLRVEDPVRFQGLLENGFGHHRGFGFGMVMLRKPA